MSKKNRKQHNTASVTTGTEPLVQNMTDAVGINGANVEALEAAGDETTEHLSDDEILAALEGDTTEQHPVETLLAEPHDEPLADSVIASIEAQEEAASSHAPETETVQSDEAPVHEAPATDPATPQDFEAVVTGINDEQAKEYALSIAKQIDARIDFEKSRPDYNANILKALEKARKSFVMPSAAKVLMAANVDPAFINRTVHDGARYNVYAFGKLADLVTAMITPEQLSNAINKACMISLFRAKANGVPFTLDLAKASASDKIAVDAAIKKWLMRHTVSASTAPTQASSTMQALATLGVVTVSGSKKSPTFTVTDRPIAMRAEQVFRQIAA